MSYSHPRPSHVLREASANTENGVKYYYYYYYNYPALDRINNFARPRMTCIGAWKQYPEIIYKGDIGIDTKLTHMLSMELEDPHVK